MVTDEEVLRFFQNELPISGLLPTKENRVKMDEALQEYAEEEDLFPRSINMRKFLISTYQ